MEALGAALGAALVREPGTDAVLVALVGELGAGKTTLVRGMLRALGHEGAVRSPTYTLLEEYRVAGRPLLHLDLYRLADAEELEYLGLRDALDEGPLVLVEWPQRGGVMLPRWDLVVTLAYQGPQRRVTMRPGSEAGRRVIDTLSA